MPPIPEDLKAVVGALADCYDQAVFLENAVTLVTQVQVPDDLVVLVEEVRRVVKAGGASLGLKGHWLTPVPDWITAMPAPARRRSTRSRNSRRQGLLLPFEGGQLAFWDKSIDFSASDIRLGETLAHLIVSTIAALEARQAKSRAQLEEQERKLAAQIWRSVVPDVLPTVPNYRLKALSQPAREVGGDFHSVAHGWVVVGDVSGKGVPAALFSTMFVASFRLAASQTNPVLALEQALSADLERSSMFATIAAARLDEDGGLYYFNLGHPPILIIRPGEVEELWATATPMGTFPLADVRSQKCQLQPGDLVCLYSDGAIEAKRFVGNAVELFGLERIAEAVSATRSPEETLSALVKALESWDIDDDLTLVVAQYWPHTKA